MALPRRRFAPASRALGAAAILASALAFATPARAGVAYRVKDLDPTVVPNRTFSLVPLLSLGSSVLAATAPTHYVDLGRGEIWVTDGTTAGTRRVRDLGGYGVEDAIALPGGALLVADSLVTGYELWWTDGTTAGTWLVRDILPGPASSDPAFVGELDGVAYFAADDGMHGRELWRSDGTPGGTWLFADLRPGSAGSLSLDRSDVAGQVYNGRLYFGADDGVHGRELWRTDGHPAGTYLLKSIVPGAEGGDPRSFGVGAGRLFFTADDGVHGAEPWVSDGSAAGTTLVRDVVPGPQGSDPLPLGHLPGRFLFFAAAPEGELWSSDGTAAGTSVVLPGLHGVSKSAAVGARMLFLAWGETPNWEVLWVTDGTAAGTFRLREDIVGAWDLRPAGDFAIFQGSREPDDSGLWRSDGTPAGTSRLGDEWCDGLSVPVTLDGTSFYACISEVGPHGWDDAVLGRTDGTPAGTGDLVLDFPSGSGSQPDFLTARGDDVVFSVRSSVPGPEWRCAASDGTEAGTRPLTYTGSGWFGGFSGGVPLADGELVFSSSAQDVGYGQLFRTDGDLVSSVTVIDNGGDWPQDFTRVGDLVFFATDRLWRTDGSAGGTAVVRWVDGFELTDVFGTLWFAEAHDYGTPTALWESHGTPATTIAHPLDFPMDSDEPNGLTALDPATGSFAFRAAGGLYRFDPAVGQAVRLKDFSATAPPHYLPFPRAVVDRTLFFFDGDPDGTCVLWKSDGTPAGTVRVANVGDPDCLWPEIVALANRVDFRGCDAAHGCELWASDGTPAGTARVADLDPGVFSSMPSELTVVGDRLYFSACDAWHGCEPWMTDGTRAGTHRLGDIAPGSDSSQATEFTAAGRRVFFSADDDTGAELWAAPLEIFYDGFETGDTSRWSETGP